ncbi:hypothetical protein FRC09_020426 [Ceratobasidium sp. 395]|nr:hypothetical protein FRC09_020426 [Ceratobasidium sp. 395]
MATETCVQQKVDDILADPKALLRVLAALGISTTRPPNARGDERLPRKKAASAREDQERDQSIVGSI